MFSLQRFCYKCMFYSGSIIINPDIFCGFTFLKKQNIRFYTVCIEYSCWKSKNSIFSMLTFLPSRSWCPSSGGVQIILIRWRPTPTATGCTRKRSNLCKRTMPICGGHCLTYSRSSPRWCAYDKRERPRAAPFCSRFWPLWPEVWKTNAERRKASNYNLH